MTAKIGLVGLGLVGTAMAERLLATRLSSPKSEQFDVVGFDIDSTKCEHLEQLGGKAVSNPAQVAEQVERVVLSLPDTDVVLQVVEGPGGILEAIPILSGPRYIIDTTTGEPDETAALAQRLARRGIHFLDAPFSGSSRQVRD